MTALDSTVQTEATSPASVCTGNTPSGLHGRFYRLRAVFPPSVALALAFTGYDVIGWAPVKDVAL